MPSIAEAIGVEEIEGDIYATMDTKASNDMDETAENTGGTSFFDRISDIDFLAETGDGPISQYMDHALNFNNSKAMARILRGVTGLIGSLNLAIIDIGVGVLEFFKKDKVAQNDN